MLPKFQKRDAPWLQIDERKGNRRSFDSLRSLRMTALEKWKAGLSTGRSRYPTLVAESASRMGHPRWLVKAARAEHLASFVRNQI